MKTGDQMQRGTPDVFVFDRLFLIGANLVPGAIRSSGRLLDFSSMHAVNVSHCASSSGGPLVAFAYGLHIRIDCPTIKSLVLADVY